MTDPLHRLTAALAGRYSVERAVGRGGMATVYLAHDARHGRDVAVKVLKPDLAQRLGADRFLREIRIAAQLQHPHVLPLYDSGSADELLYYVMPFVRGESVRALLNREKVLEPERALAITREVAGALDYAHRQGVVHRDIKPENVLLSEGHALVADFGIAKALDAATDEPLTRTGMAIGTPGYMSPEQAAGSGDLDERTDVFSLACVVFEMLVGEVPARWVTEEEVRQRRFLRAPERHRRALDRLPSGIEQALVRALAMDPEARFPTPGELAAALSGESPPARRYGDGEARAVLDRAAELDAEPTDEGFGLSTVKDIARQAEIPSRYVDAAARELARAPALAPPAPRPVRVLGLPAGINLSRTVPGEVPESEFPVLVEMIEEELGVHGRVDALFRSAFVWNSEVVGSPAQRGFSVTRVQVTPRDGSTRITITDDRTPAVAVTTGLAAVLAGGLILPFAGMGWETVTLMPALAIGVIGVAGFLRAMWRRRRARLQGLLDRLAQHVSATRR